jgi:uncharacterized protein (TIGR00369 family)
MTSAIGDPGLIAARLKGTLGDLLGIEFVEASPERVVAQLVIRDELLTVGGSLHGGTLMTFADTIGAVATVLNLLPGAGTTGLLERAIVIRPARRKRRRAIARPVSGRCRDGP